MDILQERLEEMETLNPSPSLEGVLGVNDLKYHYREIEQVKQKKSYFKPIENYDEFLENNYESLSFSETSLMLKYDESINNIFNLAKEGWTWDLIKYNINDSKRNAKNLGLKFNLNMDKLKRFYNFGIRKHGLNKANNNLIEIYERHQDGTQNSIENEFIPIKSYITEVFNVIEEQINKFYK